MVKATLPLGTHVYLLETQKMLSGKTKSSHTSVPLIPGAHFSSNYITSLSSLSALETSDLTSGI